MTWCTCTWWQLVIHSNCKTRP